VRDLWARKDLAAAASLKKKLPAHAAILYRIN
jgi:hypothetical protein